ASQERGVAGVPDEDVVAAVAGQSIVATVADEDVIAGTPDHVLDTGDGPDRTTVYTGGGARRQVHPDAGGVGRVIQRVDARAAGDGARKDAAVAENEAVVARTAD